MLATEKLSNGKEKSRKFRKKELSTHKFKHVSIISSDASISNDGDAIKINRKSEILLARAIMKNSWYFERVFWSVVGCFEAQIQNNNIKKFISTTLKPLLQSKDKTAQLYFYCILLMAKETGKICILTFITCMHLRKKWFLHDLKQRTMHFTPPFAST